jgi:hypothetical protein
MGLETGDDQPQESVRQAAPHARTAVELKSIVETERRGTPFLLWRDGDGAQQIFELEAAETITIGRRETSDLALDSDSEVSRTHAELQLVNGDWTLTDDGLSRNGTFVNSVRITQRRRLKDGDVLRIGRTVIEYRAPHEGSTAITTAGAFPEIVASLTDTQRKVLVALCRPYREGRPFVAPASNNEIASEVFLGVDAVKNHLRTLFQRFEIADLPQNQKRARLVECAFQWGLVSDRDL